MKNKRGIFFSTDILVALTIIFLSILVIYPTIRHPQNKGFIQSDLVNVLSTIQTGELNNSYLNNLILEGKIKDLNKSIIEQMGDIYVSNITIAKNLAQEVLNYMNISDNIEIWYGDDLLASKNTTSFENAKSSEVERQMISGIEKGKMTQGFISKAWLKKIDKKKNTLFIKGDLMCGGWTSFGGDYYCGTTQTNVTYKFYIPNNSTILDGTWLVEPSWLNQYTKLYLNGKKVFQGTIGSYTIQNISSDLKLGENIAIIDGDTGAEDGASHIIVQYYTPNMSTFEQQKIFPFNKVRTRSILHYEKSIFIPNQIYDMNIMINASMNTSLSFRKGNETIFIGSKIPVNNKVNFSDNEIKNVLNSKGISYSVLNSEYFFFILDIGKNSPNTLTTLGENSYIYINSSEISIPYGTIDISGEIPIKSYSNFAYNPSFYRNITWEFFLPKNSFPIYADWQLGWVLTGITTQKAIANSIILYNSPPDPFVSVFARFGYTPSKASGLFKEGENNFSLQFGNGYSASTEASYGFLTYFIKNYVNYGEVKDKARGGTKIIQFEDGSSKQIVVGDPNDIWDPSNDSIDDAVERLISQLDANNNTKIDVVLDKESFDVDNLDISGVPFMWRTEMQIRRWN